MASEEFVQVSDKEFIKINTEEFIEIDMESAEKRCIERKERLPTEFKKRMCCMPRDENRNIERNPKKLLERIAIDEIEYQKYLAKANLALAYIRRAKNENIEWSLLIQEYFQDYNYIGHRYNLLKKDAEKIDWSIED